MDPGRRALRSTWSRGELPSKLHQPAISMPYEGVMPPDDRREAAGQLGLQVERHVIAPLDGLISPNIARTRRTGR